MTPTRRLAGLLGLWLGLGLAAAFAPLLTGLWTGTGLALALVVLADAVLLARTPTPALTRRVPAALSHGEWHDATLHLDNLGGRRLAVEVFDGTPESITVAGQPATLDLPARGWGEVDYRLRPEVRGDLHILPAWLRFAGPLGLLRQVRSPGLPHPLRVFPNHKAVARYALAALDNRTGSLGIHLQRRRGEGIEFHQLREYRDGDSLRQIDWKAVSRRNQLISREYREEQDQQVIFLLDCGRRLRTRDGLHSHFDHVLNAALLLSYVALRQGDAVGLMTFSGHDRWMPPRKGRQVMPSILGQVYDLDATEAPSDYAEAAARLATRQRRRALVVLLTNLRDDDSGDLQAALAPLRKRHLVLLASLRETALTAALAAPVDDFGDALRLASAHTLLGERRRAHESVRGRGVHTLDTTPAQLPIALVNRYLEIKRAGLL